MDWKKEEHLSGLGEQLYGLEKRQAARWIGEERNSCMDWSREKKLYMDWKIEEHLSGLEEQLYGLEKRRTALWTGQERDSFACM